MPFTQEQFFGAFRDYNLAVWPVQWLLNALAIVAVGLAARGTAATVVNLILAVLWAWMGIVYHFIFFSPINPAAVWFGAAFLVQAALFLWYGVVRGRVRFRAVRDVRTLLGFLMMVYALVLYPALGHLLGRRYPAMPTFGLPCPTTIFTFGLLLWLRSPLPLPVLIIPALWSLLGFSGAASLGMTEDYGSLIAAILAFALPLLYRRRDAASVAGDSTPPLIGAPTAHE